MITSEIIAEILHRAADEFLANSFIKPHNTNKELYSCLAITKAVYATVRDKGGNIQTAYKIGKVIRRGLIELGLNPSTTLAFEEFPSTKTRQPTRYAWLKFCALLAEEQSMI